MILPQRRQIIDPEWDPVEPMPEAVPRFVSRRGKAGCVPVDPGSKGFGRALGWIALVLSCGAVAFAAGFLAAWWLA